MTDSAEKIPDLLPCPFCPDGGKPYIHKFGNSSTKSRGAEVGCDKCDFKKQVMVLRHPIEWAIDKAAEIWNTRSAPSRVTGDEVGELFKITERLIDECGKLNQLRYDPPWQTLTELAKWLENSRIRASRPTQDSECQHEWDNGNRYNMEEETTFEWRCKKCRLATEDDPTKFIPEVKAPPPEADRQRALEDFKYLDSLALPDEGLKDECLKFFQEHRNSIEKCLTAPQPHVGVEVTVEEFADHHCERHGFDKFGGNWHIMKKEAEYIATEYSNGLKITAQKKES